MQLQAISATISSTLAERLEGLSPVKRALPEKRLGRVCPEANLTSRRTLALGGQDVVGVSGDHQTMIREPKVAVYARLLEQVIDRSNVLETPQTGGEK